MTLGVILSVVILGEYMPAILRRTLRNNLTSDEENFSRVKQLSSGFVGYENFVRLRLAGIQPFLRTID